MIHATPRPTTHNPIRLSTPLTSDNDVYRVLDIVRASGVFNSIGDFHRVILSLLEDDMSVEGCKVVVMRLKDRVTKPLGNGYRDLLLNLRIEGCDGLIVELQQHFDHIISIKEDSHKIYVLLRAAGW